jgi:tetratricopeptide (TPR) repeat protein
MEQGRLGDAIDAYQKMIDLKPGPQAYSRGAHVRWLKGDLRGAIELARMAARASDPRDLDSFAGSYSRLALYELQAGDAKQALATCDLALRAEPNHAPALVARGRILLAGGDRDGAMQVLRRAAFLNPLPEQRWMLAEALRSAGREKEASAEEARLVREGPAGDPRTLALFLATRGRETETALRLAERELETRADVFTLDALAWTLQANGRTKEARAVMQRALAEGTVDARLFYHAGVIAARANELATARRWLDKAAAIQQMLLPSERAELEKWLTMTKVGRSSLSESKVDSAKRKVGREIL